MYVVENVIGYEKKKKIVLEKQNSLLLYSKL